MVNEAYPSFGVFVCPHHGIHCDPSTQSCETCWCNPNMANKQETIVLSDNTLSRPGLETVSDDELIAELQRRIDD